MSYSASTYRRPLMTAVTSSFPPSAATWTDAVHVLLVRALDADERGPEKAPKRRLAGAAK